MIKFEAGKTYSTRSIGDHNCIYSITVVARTAKTITVIENNEVPKLLRIKVSTYRGPSGIETVKPHGSYSMCAVIGADDTRELLPDWAKSQNPVVIAAHAARITS